MRKFLKLQLALALLLLPAFLLVSAPMFTATAANGGKPDSYPKSGLEQLQWFEPLIGERSGKFVFPATQWFPESTSALTLTSRWILEANHLEMRLQYEFELETRDVLAFWGYNSDVDQFVLHWIDSTSTQSTTYLGEFESGSVLVMTAQRMDGIRVINERLRVDLLDNGGVAITSASDFNGELIEGGRFEATLKK